MNNIDSLTNADSMMGDHGTFRPSFRQIGEKLTSMWLPILSILVLGLSASMTPLAGDDPQLPADIQEVAHHLSHGINSIWVGLGIILLVVPSIYMSRRHGRPNPWAWRAFDAVLLDFLFVDALGKNLMTGLVRPGDGGPGFPSGHSTMAFALAWLIWRRFPKLGPLWFCVATLIAWSRVAVHSHFAYQVVGGAIYGCVIGILVTWRRGGVMLPRIFLGNRSLQFELDRRPDELSR